MTGLGKRNEGLFVYNNQCSPKIYFMYKGLQIFQELDVPYSTF